MQQGQAQMKESELVAVLPGERRIYLLGAEAGDNLRGGSYHTIVCDERDNISDEFWRNVMLPTTNAHKENFILYLGTLSGGDSRLWRMYRDYRDNNDWFCDVIPGDKAGVYSEEQLAEMQDAMGESAYQREILCNPHAPVENSVLGEQVANAEREGRVMSFPAREGVPVMTSWDLGIRDATSVWGYQAYGRWVEYLFYREYNNMSFDKCLDAIMTEFPTLTWGEACLPHDAKNRGKEFGFSVEDITHDRYPGGYFVYQSAPNPVSTMAATRVGMKRCRFEERECEQGILRLKSARHVTAPKTGTVTHGILHDENSHALDAFRYGQYRLETLNPTSSDVGFQMYGDRSLDELPARYFE